MRLSLNFLWFNFCFCFWVLFIRLTFCVLCSAHTWCVVDPVQYNTYSYTHNANALRFSYSFHAIRNASKDSVHSFSCCRCRIQTNIVLKSNRFHHQRPSKSSNVWRNIYFLIARAQIIEQIFINKIFDVLIYFLQLRNQSAIIVRCLHAFV